MKDNNEKRKKLILELFHDDLYVPMKRKELAMFMQVSDSMKNEFDSVVDELIDEGQIVVTQKGKLVLGNSKKKMAIDKSDCHSKKDETVLIGRYIGNAKGFGFVEIEGQKEDYFIPEGESLNACHNDTVQIEVIKKAKDESHRTEARIIKIIERSQDVIVGTYEANRNYGFVVTDNVKFSSDIFIPKEKSKGAVSGHKVIVEITNYGDDKHNPEGRVKEIIGHENDPGVDILSIALAFGLPTEFPEKVLNQAENVSKPVSLADIEGRTDLRNELMVTIDGEDAKDLDDAVSLRMEDDLYILGVHIADVSNYVQENSALDKEAIKRGTSTYLADRVIPMLPHSLSNGICSLNEKEDRLALSCIMKINTNGKVIDYNICESVINVDHRMSYNQVKRIIEDQDKETILQFEDVVSMLTKMQELSLALRKKRKSRGAIDFDFPETKLILNEKGEPVELKPYDRNEATKLIESFMLQANETVSEHYYWQNIPFLYRIHEEPDDEKINKLKTFIKNFGYTLKSSNEEVHPKEFQKLLSKIEGTKEEPLISRLTLRSMQQAKYSTECAGHFGLACDYYSHFTSPIRRYPDLQIHRIIKDDLRGRLNETKRSHYEDILPQVALSTSKNERRAEEAERETVKLKKAQYMLKHLNEIYEGVISGVTNWGIYVELENTVEGLVHVSSMTGDYYRFDENKYELIGEASGTTYRLGETVKVMVHDVDMSTRTIDFILADFEEGSRIHDFYKKGRHTF